MVEKNATRQQKQQEHPLLEDGKYPYDVCGLFGMFHCTLYGGYGFREKQDPQFHGTGLWSKEGHYLNK